MTRVLIDLQSLQLAQPFQIEGAPLVRQVRGLLSQAFDADVEVHLLANGAFAKSLPVLERLFPQQYARGHFHVFHGLTEVPVDRFTGVWRRGVSDLLRDLVVADVAPELVVLPDLFCGAGTSLVLGNGIGAAAGLGFVPRRISVDAGPSRFASDAAQRAFLVRRTNIAGDAWPLMVAGQDVARELLDYPMQRLRPNVQVEPALNEVGGAVRFAALVLAACKGCIPFKEDGGWPDRLAQLDRLETEMMQAMGQVPGPEAGVSERDMAELAQAVSRTRFAREETYRAAHTIIQPALWRLEGPYDSSYSLASVNRETALALTVEDVDVALHSSEGPGDFDAEPDFLRANPDLATLAARAADTTAQQADITSRNMFPPRADDVQSPYNLLHGYAWEETGFPASYAQDINRHLQGLLVTSDHVERTLVNAGIAPPIRTVGNGVDHLQIAPVALPFEMPQAGYTILHVSSCFPRKGVDVLLSAYAQAFGKGDDVCLVIKTHDNPHNTVAADVAQMQMDHPDMAPVHIVFDELSAGQMRSLYEAGDLLVAPSRAEGFCLPVAEAVLAGMPVLTTGWSGQMAFADVPLVQFIDYRFDLADSHLETWHSVWAEPDVDDLVRLLQETWRAPAPTEAEQAAACATLLGQHNWQAVAQRSIAAVRQIAEGPHVPPPLIGWVSTFNSHCGIATYSGHLLEHLPDDVLVFANEGAATVAPDDPRITRCWIEGPHDPLDNLRAALLSSGAEVVVIQFNFGFFNFTRLAALIESLKAAGRRVVMMMHATDDANLRAEKKLATLAPAFAQCDRLLVHGLHDLNRLKNLGLVDNVALFPHGIAEAGDLDDRPALANRPLVLGTYGFFLPQKGLIPLIEAAALMRQRGLNVHLNMVNAAYPVPESRALIEEARARITALEMDAYVSLCTDFLDDADSFARLAASDLLVFPYGPTSESASGAVRQALAVRRPVAVTPLPIFDDVADLVHRLPGYETPELAEGLTALLAELVTAAPDGCFARTSSRAVGWRRVHGYSALGPHLWRILTALHRNREAG